MLECNMIILLLLLGCHPATPKTSATVDTPGANDTKSSAPASAPDSTPTRPPLTIKLTVTPPPAAGGKYNLSFDLGKDASGNPINTAGLPISITCEFKDNFLTLPGCTGTATGNVFACDYKLQWAGYLRKFQVTIGTFPPYELAPTCVPKPGNTTCSNTTTIPTADNLLFP